jgi:hypothetical protein
MKKIKLSYIAIFFVAILALGLLSFLITDYIETKRHTDLYPVEYINLKLVCSTIDCYRIDHNGELPSEEAFKESLTDYLKDVNVLSNIRYFPHEREFVLVTPGKNGKFDTPDGFENIKAFAGECDDYVLFSPYKAGPSQVPVPK